MEGTQGCSWVSFFEGTKLVNENARVGCIQSSKYQIYDQVVQIVPKRNFGESIANDETVGFALNQDEYQSRYNEMVVMYESLKVKIDEVEKRLSDVITRREVLGNFIKTLKEQVARTTD